MELRKIILFCFLYCSTALAQDLMTLQPANHNRESPGWEAIHWQDDVTSALRESKSTGKPLMVFLVVNKEGERYARQV